jgi:hypothetical protein
MPDIANNITIRRNGITPFNEFINEFISAINDCYLRLTDSQKTLLQHHMIQYSAEMRPHDPTVRSYRLRRHWGPERLTARRERMAGR